MKSFIAYLQLMRPANIITAMADILAGFSASSLLIFNHPTELIVPSHPFTALAWLLLETIGLYGGGIVFNDVFDAKVDSKERPKRPLPSGLVSQHHAATLGIGLFIFGLRAAYQVSSVSSLNSQHLLAMFFGVPLQVPAGGEQPGRSAVEGEAGLHVQREH